MSKYIVKPTKNGFKFDLTAKNGEIIASSEIYSSPRGCMVGIKSVAKIAALAAVEDQTVTGFKSEKNPKFEIFKDKAGEFRFRLKAKNGKIIATSEGYKALPSCKKGIESVKKNAELTEMEIKES